MQFGNAAVSLLRRSQLLASETGIAFTTAAVLPLFRTYPPTRSRRALGKLRFLVALKARTALTETVFFFNV